MASLGRASMMKLLPSLPNEYWQEGVVLEITDFDTRDLNIQNLQDIIHESWVIGLEKLIFSNSVAMALAQTNRSRLDRLFFLKILQDDNGCIGIGSMVNPLTFISMSIGSTPFRCRPEGMQISFRNQNGDSFSNKIFPPSEIDNLIGSCSAGYVASLFLLVPSPGYPRVSFQRLFRFQGMLLLKVLEILKTFPFISSGTLPSKPTAAVPSRSEYLKEKRLSNLTFLIKAMSLQNFHPSLRGIQQSHPSDTDIRTNVSKSVHFIEILLTVITTVHPLQYFIRTGLNRQ